VSGHAINDSNYGIKRDFRAIPVGTFLFMGLQAIAARLRL
jgi:hypothetical protein